MQRDGASEARTENRRIESIGQERAAAPLDLDSLAADRAALLDRMQRLRTVLPSFARETERARSQAARLRVENKRLLAQVRTLQARLERDPVAPRHH